MKIKKTGISFSWTCFGVGIYYQNYYFIDPPEKVFTIQLLFWSFYWRVNKPGIDKGEG